MKQRPCPVHLFCLPPPSLLLSPDPLRLTGNVTERMRMGRLAASGDTVVDLYTGIGYYTLPLLACAGVAKVGG